MVKRIEIHGQRVQLYGSDGGKTWSSSPQLIVAFERRKKRLRLDLKNRFGRMDEISEPDPNREAELMSPRSVGRR